MNSGKPATLSVSIDADKLEYLLRAQQISAEDVRCMDRASKQWLKAFYLKLLRSSLARC